MGRGSKVPFDRCTKFKCHSTIKSCSHKEIKKPSYDQLELLHKTYFNLFIASEVIFYIRFYTIFDSVFIALDPLTGI